MDGWENGKSGSSSPQTGDDGGSNSGGTIESSSGSGWDDDGSWNGGDGLDYIDLSDF